MSQTEFRLMGERHLSHDTAEQEMHQYVGKYGVKAALSHALGIATALGIDLAELGVPLVNGHTNGHDADSTTNKPARQRRSAREPAEPAPPPAAPPTPEPVYFNRKGEPITEARHNGGLTAWDTRRAIDAMMAANPRLSRVAALALYRDEHPRSRAKNLSGPRQDASKGETSWDTRIKNIIKKAAARGKTLTWQEAHDQALDSLQGSRQAAAAPPRRRAA